MVTYYIVALMPIRNIRYRVRLKPFFFLKELIEGKILIKNSTIEGHMDVSVG